MSPKLFTYCAINCTCHTQVLALIEFITTAEIPVETKGNSSRNGERGILLLRKPWKQTCMRLQVRACVRASVCVETQCIFQLEPPALSPQHNRKVPTCAKCRRTKEFSSVLMCSVARILMKLHCSIHVWHWIKDLTSTGRWKPRRISHFLVRMNPVPCSNFFSLRC